MTQQTAASAGIALTPENVHDLWDNDIVRHCKPHFGTVEKNGREQIGIDGLTIWPASSATGERVWVPGSARRFGLLTGGRPGAAGRPAIRHP